MEEEREEEKKEKKEYDISAVLMIFPVLILIGKVIRWTILKSVLVDMSIGHRMITKILEGTGGFVSFAETGMSDATGNASVFFRIFNVFHLQSLVGFEVFITFIWNLIILLLILKCVEKLDFWQFAFLVVSIIVINIWDLCLAKEPIQFLFFLALFAVVNSNSLENWGRCLFSVMVLMISVLYFRNYYILMIAFGIIILIVCEKWLLQKEKLSVKDVIKLIAILAISYFMMIVVLKVVSSSSYNELIRVRNRSGAAHTQIVNIFKSNNLIIFTINYFVIILRMLFPVEILVGIKYVPYVAYQIMISIYVIVKVIGLKQKNFSQRFAIYLYLAFLLTSAAFEPDFGSWVRHEASIFPLLLIVTECIIPKASETELIEEEQEKEND